MGGKRFFLNSHGREEALSNFQAPVCSAGSVISLSYRRTESSSFESQEIMVKVTVSLVLQQNAVSMYCRLGFAVKKGQVFSSEQLHPTWKNAPSVNRLKYVLPVGSPSINHLSSRIKRDSGWMSYLKILSLDSPHEEIKHWFYPYITSFSHHRKPLLFLPPLC